MNRLDDLQRLEEKRKKKMRLFLIGVLLSVENQQELIPKMKRLSLDTMDEIKDMRQASFDIADRYSEETHRVRDGDRQLIIMGASLYLISSLARRIAVSDNDNYVQAARQAVKDTQAVIDRLVVTEVYEANRKKIKVNNRGAKLLWNAVLDRKTCDQCEALDGKIFNEADAPDELHPNCRCILEVISEHEDQ